MNTIQNVVGIPSPKGVPVFGNIFQLKKEKLHICLEDWASELDTLYKSKTRFATGIFCL